STTDHEYTVDGDEVHAAYNVVTRMALGGRRISARVDETFLIPASDGKIHHIKVRFHPFVKR
ncbi:MAG: hypothetical protein JWR37_6030, partial [Mycobacterium sp.]|nr:hypothetical protein [Mycobacterium sp.]